MEGALSGASFTLCFGGQVSEGEEEEQEIENLFENTMKEKFPNLAKEIDYQEVQEAQRVPKELGPKEAHQGTS